MGIEEGAGTAVARRRSHVLESVPWCALVCPGKFCATLQGSSFPGFQDLVARTPSCICGSKSSGHSWPLVARLTARPPDRVGFLREIGMFGVQPVILGLRPSKATKPVQEQQGLVCSKIEKELPALPPSIAGSKIGLASSRRRLLGNRPDNRMALLTLRAPV